MYDLCDVLQEHIPDVKRDLPVINRGVPFAVTAPYDPCLMFIYGRHILSEGKCYMGTTMQFVRSFGNGRVHPHNISCCLYKNNPYKMKLVIRQHLEYCGCRQMHLALDEQQKFFVINTTVSNPLFIKLMHN